MPTYFYNISYKSGGQDNSVLVTGDIQNSSSKSYAYAIFRIFLFDKHRKILGTGTFRIADLKSSVTRSFEVLIGEVQCESLNAIAACDIVLDSGY